MAQSKAPTLRQFQDRFPTEDSCLDHLFQVRYGGTDCPKCNRPVKYSRVKGRRSYQCQWCAHNLYPTAGTPFDRTRTSLRDWFFVMNFPLIDGRATSTRGKHRASSRS